MVPSRPLVCTSQAPRLLILPLLSATSTVLPRATKGELNSLTAELGPDHDKTLYCHAMWAAQTGRPEDAVAYLRRILAAGGGPGFATDPDLAPLRGRPDFEALIAEAESQRKEN